MRTLSEPTSPESPRATFGITVVVPTFNSARTLDACLASIKASEGVSVELIVVDPVVGSTDATPEIARSHADIFLSSGDERVAQRNAGLAAASHPLIAFLDSDMAVPPTVLAEAAALLDDYSCGGVVIDEEILGDGFLITGRRLEKRLLRGDHAAEAARVFRTAEVREVGGFDRDLIAAEDFDLSDRVLAGRPAARTPSPLFHDEGRIELRRVWAKKAYYGSHLRSYLSGSGSSHRLLRRSLLLIPLQLLRHPRSGTALVILKTTEILALLRGLAHSGSGTRDRLRLRAYPPQTRD